VSGVNESQNVAIGRAASGSKRGQRFTFVDAGMPGEPSKVDVHKNGRVIGRILHEVESPHVSEIFQFHKGLISIGLGAAAQFSSLEELKKWIRETQ